MRKWIALGSIVVAVVLVVVVWRLPKFESAKETALREQLELARKEGLATTAEEFAAKMPPVKPEENAAPLYRKLKGITRNQIYISLGQQVLEHGQAAFPEAKQALKEFDWVLKLSEQAVELPKCWFDRDWTDGAAVIMPEFADMKSAARVLALRGSVAAAEGRVQDAIEDSTRIQKIAVHAGSEPTSISRLVEESIRQIALRNLAHWSFKFRDPAYAQEMVAAIGAMRKPNVREEFSDSLYHVLSLIELTKTPEGIAKLGLSEEDMKNAALANAMFSNIQDPIEAKAKIVKAQRDYLKALEGPSKGKIARLDAIQMDFYKAFITFPVAARLYEMLGSGDHPLANRVEFWESRKIQYTAAQRALASPTVPKSIKTGDLKSPFDGEPVSYKFDGKQMVITVSGFEQDGKPIALRIPPNPVKKP